MLKRIAILLAMVLALVFAAITPASADGAAIGHLTGFDGVVFSTALVDLNPAYYAAGQCIDIDPAVDNRISAWVNSSNTVNFTGYTTDQCLPGGSTRIFYHNTQGTITGTMNNNIESFRRN